jgi:hypothetical protein
MYRRGALPHLTIRPLLLALLLAGACHHSDGGRTEGSACDESSQCAGHLVCAANRCASYPGNVLLPDAAPPTDAGPDQSAPDAQAASDGAPDLASSAPDLGPDQATPMDVGLPPRGEPAELPQQYIFLVTADGHLNLNVNVLGSRLPGETFSRALSDLGSIIGGIPRIDEVEAQGVGLEMNVMVRAGRDVSVASRRGTAWSHWSPVGSGVRAMGLANHEGTLVACLVDENGHLKLASRGPGDAWTEARDITDEAAAPAGQGERAATFTKVDCAGIGPDLELVALDGEGRLWHATRKPAEWLRLHRLTGAGSLTFRAVSASNALGALHILGTTQTTQYHAARSGTGEWTSFDDLERLGAIDPGAAPVAGSQASCFAEVWWVQVTSAGNMWLSFRLRDVLIPFWSEQPAPSVANPYVSAAMAFTLP